MTRQLKPNAAARHLGRASIVAASLLVGGGWSALAQETNAGAIGTQHKTVTVQGLEVFYREAGPKDAPTILLLHGFPTSSQMFRNLIPALADKFHLVAPDYPGFGNSAMPPVEAFDYSFDNLATVIDGFTQELGLERNSLYVVDYGAPVGFRLATAHPERVQALIVSGQKSFRIGTKVFGSIREAYA